MACILSVENVNKVYQGGFQALKDVNLEIEKGEIFALLGPNGAGKTTLISIICGLANATSGRIMVDGHDIVDDYRLTRSMIGLVPQELSVAAFEKVWDAVSFTRGLFGQPKDPAYIEKILKELHLWDKKDQRLMALSGGMKRRLLIAKALSHQPKVLFLDEPTAGVDVELRKDMWETVSELRESGVTVILTTHYIEEAEEMADRIGVINGGEIVLVEKTKDLLMKMGRQQLALELDQHLGAVPQELSGYSVKLSGSSLVLNYDPKKESGEVAGFLDRVHGLGLRYRDLQTKQSSLEEIFVELVKK